MYDFGLERESKNGAGGACYVCVCVLCKKNFFRRILLEYYEYITVMFIIFNSPI